ncbi:uncharacterized protein RCO7_03646 [Rhynchosporium graminicola]|uniref:Uncharacterized protein n=1 Tax=Rhynchosporium graminicola TaxID=2792576 RepID=A0A1E1LGA3_9HELO|nr:uncharacterized protein RCO7_03646 [Rhynchosporium commune]
MKLTIVIHCLLGIANLTFAQESDLPGLLSEMMSSSSTLVEVTSTLATSTFISTTAVNDPAPLPTKEPAPAPELEPSSAPEEVIISIYSVHNPDQVTSKFSEPETSQAPIPETRISMISGYSPDQISSYTPAPASTQNPFPETQISTISGAAKSQPPQSTVEPSTASTASVLSLTASSESMCLCPSAIFTSTSTSFIVSDKTCQTTITSTATAPPNIITHTSTLIQPTTSILTINAAAICPTSIRDSSTKSAVVVNVTKTITSTATITKVRTVVTRIRTTLVVEVTRTKIEVVWRTETATKVVTKTKH